MPSHGTNPDSGHSQRRPSRRAAGTAMWAAIALSLLLFGLLVARGWQDSTAATTAAAVLLIACVATCLWAAAQGRTAEREVDRAISRLTAIRKQHQRRSP